MKPVRLVMRAVGPFPVEQVVDFRRLGDRSLFLVNGPTGAGKTTILDALCYALYGVCSGGDRDPNRIRSDYALPSTATEVILDFRLGRDLYRVYRRPEQQGVGKRGNQTRTRADALLTKRTGLHDDSTEGTVIAVKPKEVTKAVEDILGFKSDQFRQVVVLPQGEFRRFLASGSADREKILEVLFQTELYRRIEEALKAAAKEVADSITDERRQVSLILQNSGAETADELQQRQMLDHAKLNDILAKLEDLKKAEETARERLNHGKLILERLNEVSAAVEALAVLEQRIGTVAGKRVELEAARKAETLVGREEILNKRIAEAELAFKKVDTAQRALERANTMRVQAETVLGRESGRQAERDQLKQSLGQLELLSERVSELHAARKRLSLAEQQLAQLEAGVVAAAEAVEQAKAQWDDNQRRTSELEKIVVRLELLRHQSQEAERSCKLGRELRKRRADLDSAEKELHRITTLLEQVRQKSTQAHEEFKNLEAHWIRGQAAILARDLAPGLPCPVCGSTNHPSPAISETELPDGQTLKAKNADLEKLRTEADHIAEERLGWEKEVARLSEAVKSAAEGLGEHAA
ncbi:MAG: SMC family ATPase, partial [Desulfomonile sp.]|nr:SMC family ATPase [Desulfomonile sp.]